MKVLSIMKKAALSVCAVILGVCCWNIATVQDAPVQENYIEAKAETTTSTSIDYRGSYDGSAHMNYFYLQFAGFTTPDDYEGYANSDYVFQNILLNGKSLYEINNSTDTTGWTWDTFPQNADSKWCKPVIGYIKDTKGRIQLRIHNNYTEALYAESGNVILTVREGFTLNGYTIDKETSYRFVKDSNATYGITVKDAKESTPTVDWRGAAFEGSGTVYGLYLHFAGFTTKDDYAGYANSDYVFKNILLNGKSLYDINKTTDVTGWAWDKFPQVDYSPIEEFRKPVMGYIKDTQGRIQLRIHNNYIEQMMEQDGYVKLTVNKLFSLNGYIAPTETSFTLMSLENADPITMSTWSNFPNCSQMYYTYVNFEGFSQVNGYDGDANSDFVFQNIYLNGTSIYDINKNANVTGWTWEAFPQRDADGMPKFQKPVIGCIENAGKLQLRIHKNLYDQLIASCGAMEVTVNKGFALNGYRNVEKATILKSTTGNFYYDAPTVLDASAVSLSRWQPMASQQLIYFDIKYSAFPKLDYVMMDDASYKYIANMIAINGVKMSEINKNTNTSGWEWLQFPSTAGAIYQKPFVTAIGAGSMEVRMHNNYWETIKEDGLTVTLCAGYYIENNGTMYVLNEDVSCTKDPDVNDYVSEGGFVQALPENVYKMLEGASVRMSEGSTGIRFTAQVSKAYLDAITANGGSYKLMMQINRENSSKTAYVECTNVYEEGNYILYNVAIVNLKESSYSLTYTAKPYVEITDANGAVSKYFTQDFMESRSIKDVAYSAYTDISATYDAEKYPYEIVWEGKVQYSPYSATQRDILASFVTDAVMLSDGVYKFENESNGNFLMLSDNTEVNAFFNEYADRFVYYYKDFHATGDYVTDTVVGNASTSWKDWEAESILFIDSLHLNGNDEQFKNDIQGISVDKYGYVWEGDSFFGQGWAFPTYVGSREKTSDPFLSDGWEFENGRKNSAILAIDPGATGNWGACDVDWSATGDGTFASATVDSGVYNNDTDGYFLAHAQNSTLVTYSLEDTRSSYNGVLQAEHSPFVEIGLQWNVVSGNVNEMYLEFKAGNGNYVSLPLSTWATTEADFSSSTGIMRLYVPVFEHASWTGKITGLRIKIEGNFSAYFYLDFVRGCYDTRMIDTNTSFISAGKQHFENTGDLAYLTANMPRYRKALMFLTNYMTDNGLINLSNLNGHDGSAQGFATSFVSTYWDIVSLAPNSSYVNALYYKALMNMAYLEDALTANNVTVERPTVKTTLTGADITYNYTASQLRSMAETVKAAVSANLNETNKTGYFKTFNVTVNGQTLQAGRFIDGYYGNTQIDFGAVALNLMILESGVATEEQKELVLNWMASVDDLYEYTFAPKTNTEDLGNQYCWGYAVADYGVSCQNGGAILFVSYYDILARAQVYGANNAYERLQEIMVWFADVEEAFAASGETNAKKFFEPYYNALGLTLQGRNEEGSLGLHAEFVENAILYALVPNAFFGMDTYYQDNALVMQIAPNLPDAIGTWKMEQVRYAGLTYDVAVANNFVVVCNVEDYAKGALDRNTKLAVTLSYTGNTPKVYINNKLVTEGYTVDTAKKTVTVLVDFMDVSISVK